MIYAANHGAYFPRGGDPLFLVSKMYVEHRKAEDTHVAAFVRDGLGIATELAAHTWEGQADIATLGPNRFILTWGVRTVHEACARVRDLLPKDAEILELKIRDPYFHGDTCMSVLPGHPGVLMVYPGSLVDRSMDDLRAFASGMDVLEISEADALAYACNGLAVDQTLVMPTGLSAGLVDELGSRGYDVRSLDFGELFGKGGGGPRCLVNELRGMEAADVTEGARYTTLRPSLEMFCRDYPGGL
jgi:N-dimethylarginine dimethylaminohydrolase